jgi:iron complex outermembrane receptor protein
MCNFASRNNYNIYKMKKTILLSSIFLSLISLSTFAGRLVNPFDEVSLLDSSKVFDLDEVVVISQPKEAYRLRRQPVSSSIFSSAELQKLNIRDLRELSSYVPSFTMPNYGSRLTSSMYIRGIGSRVNNPAVGIYMDGIPLLNKSAFNFHTYELSRVDVLRGPQGTLYGQNTEGGLVRLYSRNPMDYQGTDVHLGWGTHLFRNVEISHYAKLSNSLALSLAGFYDGQNGFFHNTFNGERADRYNEAGGKFRLFYRPTSRLSFDYIADYQYVRQNGFPYGSLDLSTGRAQDPNTNYQGNYRRNIFNTGIHINYAAKGFDINSTTSYQYLKDYMMMDQDYLPIDYMHLEQRQFQNALTQEISFKSNNSSRWHWVFGVFGSYEWLKTQAPIYFGDGITGPIAGGIQSAMYNGMLNAMAAKMIAAGMSADAAKAAAAAAIEQAGGVSMNVDLMVPGLFHTPQFNLGLYHESNFDITDNLVATLGLRYDYSHVKLTYDTNAEMTLTANVMGQQAAYVLSSVLNNTANNHYNQLLPKFGLTYKLAENGSNLYATVSKGFRAGGFNIQMFSDILQTELNANSAKAMRGSYDVPHTDADYERIAKTISYKPEESWNYELGTHLNLFDNMLHFDLAGFYMQVRNQQLSVMAGNYGFGRMMVNAGKSYSCGIETTLRGSLFDNHLDWTVAYSLTHAVFKDYKDSATVNGVKTVIDYKDKKVPYVPMHSLSAVLDYRIDFSGSALKSLIIGANMTAQGRIYWDESNTYSQKFYAVAGAHADASFGRFVISLWGRNITNTRYNVFAINSAATGTTQYFAEKGAPSQFGVDFRIHF